MAGLFGWLLRLAGVNRRPAPSKTSRPAAAIAPDRVARGAQRRVVPVPLPRSEEYWLARRRVVIYIARARLPIRQAAAVRQTWLADLSKVYAQIATSPTGMVLEKAGAVGAKHEPGFRDALAFAQSIDPPLEAEHAHAALVGWLTCLHAACLALMDARKLRDRSLLGNFRDQLGFARRLAVVLVHERSALFTAYRVTMRPTIKGKRAPTAEREGAQETGLTRRAEARREALARKEAAGPREPAAHPTAVRRPKGRGRRTASGRSGQTG